MKRRATLSYVPAILATLLLACGDDPPPQVASVTLTPASVTLTALDETQRLTVTARDAGGTAIQDATISWSTSDDGVALVDVDGVVTARSNGTATVTAHVMTSMTEASATASVTVAQEASSVVVTAPVDSLVAGETAQLSAEAADANGFTVDRAVAWSSSDEEVATVDDTGLVTGTGSGEAVITASLDEASGTASFTVRLRSVSVASDTTLSGTVAADTFTVAQGATLTVDEDFLLQAEGPVTLAGSVVGDCVAVEVEGTDSVTVTGSVDNTCSAASESAPPVRIFSTGPIVMNGATITGAGGVFIGDTALADTSAAAVAARRAAPARVEAEGLQVCLLTGVEIQAQPTGFSVPTEPAPGVDVACRDGGVITGSTFRASDGRDGETVEGTGAVQGEPGQEGGGIHLRTEFDASVLFTAEAGPSHLYPGSGGDGGDAISRGDSPDAVGGNGGSGGRVSGVSTTLNMLEGALELHWSSGGNGGSAWAYGIDGADATSNAPAQPGESAMAKGGDGGGVAVLPQYLSPSTIGHAGSGGDATAVAGNGGDGSVTFPDGTFGGNATAWGGNGGWVTSWFEAFEAGLPRTGGSITLVGGNGGAGVGMCPDGEGGQGGIGGVADGRPGEGSKDEVQLSDDVETTFSDLNGSVLLDGFGNGGPGGDGTTPGSGGSQGVDDLEETFRNGTMVTRTELSIPNFQPGPDGSGCDQEVQVDANVTVQDDPAGHEPFVKMTSVSKLTLKLSGGSMSSSQGLAAAALGTLTISGNGNWITVTGSADDNGNFSATGSGDAAGFSNVSVIFQGQLALDASGLVTGVSGTLTVGAAGELFGQPVYYTVTGG